MDSRWKGLALRERKPDKLKYLCHVEFSSTRLVSTRLSVAELRKRLAFIIVASSIYFIMSINIMRDECGCRCWQTGNLAILQCISKRCSKPLASVSASAIGKARRHISIKSIKNGKYKFFFPRHFPYFLLLQCWQQHHQQRQTSKTCVHSQWSLSRSNKKYLLDRNALSE